MKEEQKKSLTLYCFTPAVTLATFLIEAVLAIVTLVKYRKTKFGILSFLLLVFLSVFQFSEYIICKGGDPTLWHKIGWVSITFLPIIGLGLVDLLVGKSVWTKIGFAFMCVFAFVAALVPGVVLIASCQGNYVHFPQFSTYEAAYSAYYLGFLMVGLVRLLQALMNKRRNPAVPWMIAGYFSFMFPTFIIFTFIAVTDRAFPSVFCGFAILLALIMIGKVLPIYHAKTSKRG